MSKTTISTTDLSKALQSINPPAVFDVRKKPAFEDDPDMIPGATWQIHDGASNWASALPTTQPIVVYCVHGHEVSQNTAAALRDMGFNACYLQGGFEGWKETGLPVKRGKK